MKNKYYYVITLSKQKTIEVEIPNAESLEACDKHTATNFKNKEDLYFKLTGNIQYDTNTRVCIKELIRCKDVNGKVKSKTKKFTPIYESFNCKQILKVCRYVLSNPNLINNAAKLHDIRTILNKENIEYNDYRECYFILKQIKANIDLTYRNNHIEDEPKISNRNDPMEQKKSMIRRIRITDSPLLNSDSENYAKYLKEQALAETNYEKFIKLYDELLDFLGGCGYNIPLSQRGGRR